MKKNDAKKVNRAMENITARNEDLLEIYREQTVNEGKHDYHVDGYYGDYSDDCCC